MIVRHRRALLLGVIAVLAVAPPTASATVASSVTSQGVTYTCGPEPSDLATPPPTPPPSPSGATANTKASAYPEICPTGDLPVIPTNSAPKAGPVVSATTIEQQEKEGVFSTPAALEDAHQALSEDATKAAVRSVDAEDALPPDPAGEEIDGGVYWHDIEQRVWPWTEATIGLWTEESQEHPIVDTNETGGHSLGQLWAIDDSPGPSLYSDVETGWITWSGCAHTNFFVYHFDRGEATGYSREFVQVSNKQVPSTGCSNGTVLSTDDTWHEFGIHRYEENWWVYHDGEWIGYYPKSAFPLYMFYGLLIGEAGGEVGEPAWDYYPYTQMGNGQAGDSGTAAMFKEVWREKSNGEESTWLSLAEPFSTESCRYSLGHFHELGTGDFRYGGPGWTVGGSCPTGQ